MAKIELPAIFKGEQRRTAILGSVGVGGIVLLLLAKMLMGGGGGGPTPSPASLPLSGATAPGAAGATAGTPLAPAQEGFEVFTARNPFRPLISATPAVPVDPNATTTIPAAPNAPNAPNTPTTVPGTPPPPPSGVAVALLDIFNDSGVRKARVQVDVTIYTVTEGQTFALNFQAISLTDRCGEFLHADVRFSLCVGESVVT